MQTSSIGREVGASYKTVQEYFQILEDALLGFLLEPLAKARMSQDDLRRSCVEFSTTESDRCVDRPILTILELTISPDKSSGEAVPSVAQLRLACANIS